MAFIRGDTIAVRVSKYTQDGKDKYRYKTIGRVLVNDQGDEILCIDRTFNPAGVLPDGRDSITLYRFEARDEPRRDRPYTQEELDDVPF